MTSRLRSVAVFTACAAFSVLVSPAAVHAAASDFGLATLTGDQFGLRSDSPAQFIGGIVSWVLGIVGVLLVVLIFYGGVMYMTAAGSEDRAKTAKRIIMFAIVGLVITMTSFIVATFVVRALTNSGTTTTTTGAGGVTIYATGLPYNGPNPNNETWCNPPAGFYCDYGIGGATQINDIERRGGSYSFNERSSSFRTDLPERTDSLLFPQNGDKPAGRP